MRAPVPSLPVLLLATLVGVAACAPPPQLETCDGIAAATVEDYHAGALHADISGDRDERLVASGIVTLTDTPGGQVQVQVRASDAASGAPSTASLVVDCYKDAEPEDGATWTDAIGDLFDAQFGLRCWAWYDLLATDPVEGENAHYVTDSDNTGQLSANGGYIAPLDDGTPGAIGGEIQFDAIDSEGAMVRLDGGSFDLPVCRIE